VITYTLIAEVSFEGVIARTCPVAVDTVAARAAHTEARLAVWSEVSVCALVASTAIKSFATPARTVAVHPLGAFPAVRTIACAAIGTEVVTVACFTTVADEPFATSACAVAVEPVDARPIVAAGTRLTGRSEVVVVASFAQCAAEAHGAVAGAAAFKAFEAPAIVDARAGRAFGPKVEVFAHLASVTDEPLATIASAAALRTVVAQATDASARLAGGSEKPGGAIFARVAAKPVVADTASIAIAAVTAGAVYAAAWRTVGSVEAILAGERRAPALDARFASQPIRAVADVHAIAGVAWGAELLIEDLAAAAGVERSLSEVTITDDRLASDARPRARVAYTARGSLHAAGAELAGVGGAEVHFASIGGVVVAVTEPEIARDDSARPSDACADAVGWAAPSVACAAVIEASFEVEPLVDHPIAVVVDAVTDLLGAGMNIGVGVVAVRAQARGSNAVAVAVAVEAGDAVAFRRRAEAAGHTVHLKGLTRTGIGAFVVGLARWCTPASVVKTVADRLCLAAIGVSLACTAHAVGASHTEAGREPI